MKGFALIEVLVTVAIFTVLVGLGLFMSMETFKGSIYRSEEATIVSLLQKARSRAMANIDQSEWSVCYVAPNYRIVSGADCILGTAYDTVAANSASTVTFTTQIVFTQLSATTTGGTVKVEQDGRSNTITVNYEGTIIW